MYISIAFFGFSDWRKSSWAQTSAAMPSSIGPLTKIARSRSRREKMSKARSPRLDSSTTIGTSVHHAAHFISPVITGRSRLAGKATTFAGDLGRGAGEQSSGRVPPSTPASMAKG